MLVNAHPVKIVFNAVAAAVAFYYLWFHQGINALIFGFGICLLGTVFSLFRKLDHNKIATTFLGEFFMCYTTGIGFALYLASHILIPWAFWLHNLYVGLLGLLLLLVGALIYKKVLT
jgi:hypothetical protein